jgi:hypothetical protein
MDDFERIRFLYFPSEAELAIVRWFLRKLDHKLSETDAGLLISDMKFGRGGLEISYCLTDTYTEELESVVEEEMDWICRRVTAEL